MDYNQFLIIFLYISQINILEKLLSDNLNTFIENLFDSMFFI